MIECVEVAEIQGVGHKGWWIGQAGLLQKARLKHSGSEKLPLLPTRFGHGEMRYLGDGCFPENTRAGSVSSQSRIQRQRVV